MKQIKVKGARYVRTIDKLHTNLSERFQKHLIFKCARRYADAIVFGP